MIATIFISLALVVTIYPIGIFLLTGLNPLKFAKKIFKVGMFAAATQSSAATLPLKQKKHAWKNLDAARKSVVSYFQWE